MKRGQYSLCDLCSQEVDVVILYEWVKKFRELARKALEKL